MIFDISFESVFMMLGSKNGSSKELRNYLRHLVILNKHQKEGTSTLHDDLPYPTPFAAPTSVPGIFGGHLKSRVGDDCPTRNYPSQAPKLRTIAGYLKHVGCRFDLGQTLNIHTYENPRPTPVTFPWDGISFSEAFDRAADGSDGGGGNPAPAWSPFLQGTVGYRSSDLLFAFFCIFFFVLVSSCVFDGILWGIADSWTRLGKPFDVSTPSNSSSHPEV
jgi:hypothetical protein